MVNATNDEKQIQKYPIIKLNGNICEKLDKLCKEIHPYIVEDSKFDKNIKFELEDYVSNVAYISNYDIKGSCRVTLSIAYCQFLWIFCDTFLKEHDYSEIIKSCKAQNITIDDYKKNTKKILEPISKERVQYIIKCILEKKDFDNMEPFLQAQLQILNEESFSENNSQRFKEAMGLLNNNQKHNFSKYTFDGDYDKITTSAYCFGIVFILFHELAHYLLGHLSKNEETLNDEECADDKAFWDIYMAEGLGEKEKFTANVGILLALFSLLFMNPKMKSDNIHPREDVRIFNAYDKIKDEGSKYTTLVVSLFKDWANKFEIKEFPNVGEKKNDNALNKIRLFLSSKKEFD